ncbi:MAG: efflux RND transporter periplasmic adaptor subunit [Pseudomonadota bacterium]
MLKKEIVVVCGVILAGLMVAAVILLSDKKASSFVDSRGHGGEDGHKHDADKGKHGGKMLTVGSFELEIVIYENGMPPHFRIYPYKNDKALEPQEVNVSVELERLGDKTTIFRFNPEQDYLVSDQEIEEPHSFFVKVLAEWNSLKFDWEYSHYEGRLTLSPELAKKMGIETAMAGPQTIRSILALPGEIALNTDMVSRVVPRVSGLILKSLKNLGDIVTKDELIAVVDSRELGEAKSQYLLALEREKLARYNFDRSQQLWEKQTVPEKEFLTAKKAFLEEKIGLTSATRKLVAMGLTEHEIVKLEEGSLSDLTNYPIRAAFEGIVVKKRLSTGEWLKDDAEIYVIADLSTVWVEITVYPKDLESVHIGQKAVVRSSSSTLEMQGEVSYVGLVVGEESRTAKARVVIPNSDGKWRPGLFVKVELVCDEKPVPVAVQSNAIQTHGNKSVVFVNYDDQFEARPIKLGLSDGHFTEVIKGLSPGENYVVKNSFVLKSEIGKAGMSHQH